VSEEEYEDLKELILMREEERKSLDSGQKRAGMTEGDVPEWQRLLDDPQAGAPVQKHAGMTVWL